MARRKTNLTKLEIMQAAMRMFLEKGFTNTSAKAISNELNISTGNLTFYYPTKEHILLELTKEITEFHTKCIDKVLKDNDDLLSYCWEIAAQIILCEQNENAKDLYLAIYSHPMTMHFVKDWTAEKNQRILGERLKDWDYDRFRQVENVTSCIERSALAESCTESYTTEDKIRLILTCLLKIYDISTEERERVIKQILDTDYSKMGHDLFKQLSRYVGNQNKQAITKAIEENRKNKV